MTKPIRFLIVFIVFLAMVIFAQGNQLHSAVAGKAIPAFRVEATAVAASTDNSPLRKNLVLLEFFSGL